ncbi:MAG: hypothetical protein L3J74_10800 [Bacteroidales bacterium]|nr:hypothetical protein [Bacteroidales bacterium]
MEKHLQEIQYIEDFLLGKLNDKEKAEFEQKLKTDAEFAKKVKQQALIMKRIRQIAIKKSIGRVHNSYLRRQRFSFRNIVKNPRNAFLTFLGIILIGYLVWEAEMQINNQEEEKVIEQIQKNNRDTVLKNNLDTILLTDTVPENVDEEIEGVIYVENPN